MASSKKSPYVHTMIKCQRGFNYSDLIFFNDFGKRFVNFHGAQERVSYGQQVSKKHCDDYYICEIVNIPSQNQFSFEELEEKIQSVIQKPYSSWSNNGTHSSKELQEKLNIQNLPCKQYDKKNLIA